MNDPLSASPIRRRPRSLLLKTRILAPALAAFFALQCAPLQADESDDEALLNAVSAPQAAVPWMSGGVGEEARAEMRKAAADYNVHLMFSDRQGAYLSGIPVSVRQRNGHEIYSGVSDGPLLYLKLPPGAYHVSAMIDGAWQNRRVQVAAAGRSARTSFIARGQ